MFYPKSTVFCFFLLALFSTLLAVFSFFFYLSLASQLFIVNLLPTPSQYSLNRWQTNLLRIRPHRPPACSLSPSILNLPPPLQLH
ncbi:hypothetical protein Godav_010312, partial [Gossypium davidsonii]|nr:hypothetical protein [Gossypium davidsonii]MBA0660605.1 hypothetical protein [Gossypium klotzschianum]